MQKFIRIKQICGADMWNKPWGMKEGFAIGIALIVIGLVLQFSIGAVEWGLLRWPVNIIILAVFLVAAVVLFFLRSKVRVLRYFATLPCAVPALVLTALITIVMGLTRQVPDGQQATDSLGITRMLSFWPFVLLYVYVAFILSQVTLVQLTHFSWRKLPSLFSHVGLLMSLLTATLGSADMQQLTMTVNKDYAESRVYDSNTGAAKKLNISIRLKDFTIDEYPPITAGDSTYYEEWHESGALTAIHLKATPSNGGKTYEGWVTAGSYLYPYQLLKVTEHQYIIMAEREPQRYVSKVEILTESGKHEEADILVNQPYSIMGWKIYQLSYDVDRGKWSEISVLELVRDPWLPYVYTGIYMMIAGAVMLLFTAQRRKQ